MWRWAREQVSVSLLVLYGLLLAILLGYTYFAFAQWAVMQRTLEGSTRAWIVLQDLPAPPKMVLGKPLRFDLRLVNAGRNPAQEVRISVQPVIAAPDHDPPECRHAPEGAVPSVIGPGQTRTITVETPGLWQQLVESLEAGTQVLRVCGVLDYQDGFRTARLTRFCLQWDAKARRFEYCPRYNEVS